MKTIIAIISIASILSSCKSSNNSKSSNNITAEDVAWASGWTIYKWDVSKLTSQPIYGFSLVVLDEKGKIVSTLGSMDPAIDGTPSRLDGELTVALKKEEKRVSLKLRYKGLSLSTQAKDIFDACRWNTFKSSEILDDLVILAHDNKTAPFDPKEVLQSKCHKLCLRFITKKRDSQVDTKQPTTAPKSKPKNKENPKPDERPQ